MNTQDGGNRRLGWHWFWFAPVCLAVLYFVELHTIPSVFALLRLAVRRWSWGVLISPSAYFCLGAMSASVLLPIQWLMVAAALIKDDGIAHHGRYAVLLIVAIFLLPFVTDALMWGSFPLTIDNAGVSRIRMIPFIPWPSGHFGQY